MCVGALRVFVSALSAVVLAGAIFSVYVEYLVWLGKQPLKEEFKRFTFPFSTVIVCFIIFGLAQFWLLEGQIKKVFTWDIAFSILDSDCTMQFVLWIGGAVAALWLPVRQVKTRMKEIKDFIKRK